MNGMILMYPFPPARALAPHEKKSSFNSSLITCVHTTETSKFAWNTASRHSPHHAQNDDKKKANQQQQQQQQRNERNKWNSFSIFHEKFINEILLFRRVFVCVYLLDSVPLLVCDLCIPQHFVRTFLLYIFFWKRNFPVFSLRKIERQQQQQQKLKKKSQNIDAFIETENNRHTYQVQIPANFIVWNKSRCLYRWVCSWVRARKMCVCVVKSNLVIWTIAM